MSHSAPPSWRPGPGAPALLLLIGAASCAPEVRVVPFDGDRVWTRWEMRGGLREGPYLRLYPSQAIEVEGRYTRGLPDGEWTERYEDGTPRARRGFRAGWRHGRETTWYADGTERSAGEWVEGDRDGEWLHYREDGSVYQSERWERGTRVEVERH